MSNFMCGSCGANWLDMDAAGFKTDKQVEAENLWHDALAENNKLNWLIGRRNEEIKRLKALLKKRNATIKEMKIEMHKKDQKILCLEPSAWIPMCEDIK